MRLKALSLLCGLVLAACGSSGSGTPPYTLVAFDKRGDFYRVDPSTGNATLILETYYQVAPTEPQLELQQISSAVYNPATDQLWMGGGGGNVCPGCLLWLDMGTGKATKLADKPDENVHAIPGMAIGPDGAIYAPQYEHKFDPQPQAPEGLYGVNRFTGVSSQLSTAWPGAIGNGMTFDGAGEMYMLANGKVYWIDIDSDATASPVVPPYSAIELRIQQHVGFPFDPGTAADVVSMTTRPTDGVIFCILKQGAGRGGGSGASGPSFLATVDIATGTVTHVAQLPQIMDGLCFVPTEFLP